jgi:hypothetical protein
LATLWQISQKVLATFANSTYLPEGCQIASIDICKRFAPLTKKRDNLFAIPLKKLKVNLKIKEATDSF